jgi:hypothetical protein
MRVTQAHVLIAAVTFVLFALPALGQLNTACGNGDFESGLDPREWSGGHGVVLRTGDPYFAGFTLGLIPGMASGALNAGTSHQTWVDDSELDPFVGIRRVAPGGSRHAVRIGNSACDAGADMLSKTFIVDPDRSVIQFKYALVFQDGGHKETEQSSFWVRVLDGNGTPLSGVVSLVNNSDKLVADLHNPAFVQKPGTDILYRDWSCAVLDLSGHVGQIVTVQFITEDCSVGGHFAYAYLDDYCGSCGEVFSLAGSSICGVGKICFNYELPIVEGVAGLVIGLDILQNGVSVTSLSSDSLKTGTSYCFDIDPNNLPLSPGVEGFDYKATGTFYIGDKQLERRFVGSSPNGVELGPNNDYKISCGTPGCCPGFNAIVNGNFEAGDKGFASAYAHTADARRPGEVAVLDAAAATAVASTWNVNDSPPCNHGRFLVANGATGKMIPSRMIWSETVPVEPGSSYRFCASFRRLPQCAFDVSPEFELRFSSPSDAPTPGVPDPCGWQQESRTIRIPEGVTSLTSAIWLSEAGRGDGNDLAVDDISLQETRPAAAKYLEVSIGGSEVVAGLFHVTAMPLQGQPYDFAWAVCEADRRGECVAGTRMAKPEWQTPGKVDFAGYVFEVGKIYRVTYGVFGFCTSITTRAWYLAANQAGEVVVSGAMPGL